MDLGWKTSSDASSLWTFNMVDHCTKIGLPNLATCVSNDTFVLSDYLKEAHSGLFRPASKSLSQDSLWTEDMTFTFTLRLSQIMTRDDSDAIVFSLNTSQSFSYSLLLHDQDFFLLSINPYSLPTKSWRLEGDTLKTSGYYHDLTLTKHKRLNLDRRPCEEDLSYSFSVCVQESVSEKVGCRLPWDTRSRQDRVVSTSNKQFSKFEWIYKDLVNADADAITKRTGCKVPCNYKEYKFVESSPNPLSIPSSVAFWAASSKTQIEEEVLLYPFTSLIADFGGYLGLFLGFSFLAIWQEIRGYFWSA